jgi:hypothetical protein
MSAYDNPTIIKDDSAMIWAQALGSAGQTFTESFRTATKEREAKEREARLEAEKKAREEKEQTINNQIYSSEERYKYQARMGKIDDGLAKAGVGADGADLVNGFIINTSEINGQNNVDIKTKVLSKEELDKKNAYASQVAKGEENLVRVAGGLYSQAQAVKIGDINDTNIGSIKFKGDNILDQTLNRVTTYALAYPDNNKTTKELDYDANGDPSKITLNVTTKVGDYNTLIKTFTDTNPGVSKDEVNAKINEGISKGFIIKGSNDQYSINFKKDINSDYDGELYTKIPEIEYGKVPVTMGIYSKEGNNDISPVYMQPTEFADSEGNASLSASEGTVKYQRTPIDMEAMKASLKPGLQAKAEGLIASSFQDPDTADGILAKLGFGTNYQSKEFAKYDLATKVNLLAGKMEENEIANIIQKSQLVQMDGKYYKTDPESIKIFNKPSSKSSGTGGLTANQQAKAAQLAAKEAKERAKLSDTRSTRPVEAGNGKTRIVWSGKGWVKQDKASGGWVEDIDSPSIRSKTEAGKAYLGL